MSKPVSIRRLWSETPVKEIHDQLLACPELWNQHTARTKAYAHTDISDIWVRAHHESDDLAKFSLPHESVWYPCINKLDAIVPIVFNIMRMVEGEHLGGLLITKIPPGGAVHPHVDNGWHAEFYQKFAVQIAGNEQQEFHFEDRSLKTVTGDIFTFNNQLKHWVTNDSDEDRITMIVCIRSRLDFLGG